MLHGAARIKELQWKIQFTIFCDTVDIHSDFVSFPLVLLSYDRVRLRVTASWTIATSNLILIDLS